MSKLVRIVIALVVAVIVIRTLHHPGSSTTSSSDASGTPFKGLTILAGSELKDLEFLKPEIEQAVGQPLRWQYMGTLDMVDRLTAPQPDVSLVWAASGKYLSLAAAGKVKASEKIMLSPVILGVKASTAKALGWDRSAPTWADIAAAAQAGRFRYGMTNPTASNSGFCAVVGVAAALSGKTDGLSAADIPTAKLKTFFSGQKLTAGSSGWLADAYVKDPSGLDGLINYESVILSLDTGGGLTDPLVPVYPKEGIITSDYPLMLVDEAQRPAFDKLVAFLKRDDVQRRLMEQTHRRPVVPTVAPAAEFGKALLIELPFPGTLDTLDALLTVYQDDLRRPGHAYFVLDTSGSMQGSRLAGLQQALESLADGSAGGSRFTRFNLREKVDLIPFAGDLKPSLELDFGPAAADYQRASMRLHGFTEALSADGGTAIYDALMVAYRRAAADRAREPDRYYSIVLMTDGENNEGIGLTDFQAQREALGDGKAVRVFPILFGEGDNTQMQHIAELTGGRTFDGRKASLAQVFKEIRGYQ